MGKIEFIPTAKMRKAAGQRKPRKRRTPTSADVDPRVKLSGRLYEITYYDATAEHVVVTKWRIRAKRLGLEDNVYSVGDTSYYFGLVEENIGRDKWSPIGFGWLPVADSFVREVIETESKPTEIKKEPKRDETSTGKH